MRIVVPYPAGIAPDTVTRLVAQGLSEKFGQQFIVDNRPGGSSNIGTEIVVRAAPDGYTLLWVTATNAINVSLYDKLSFDLVRDIAPVSGLVQLPLVIGRQSVGPGARRLRNSSPMPRPIPAKSITHRSAAAPPTNVAGELFKMMAGVNLVNVPYRANYLPDLVGGQVQASFSPILQVGRIHQSRQAARAGGDRRDALGGVAGRSEPRTISCRAMRPMRGTRWARPRTRRRDIIDTLNKAIKRRSPIPAMKARFADLGAEPMIVTPAEFGKFIVDETEKWGKVVQAANIKPE